MTDDDLRVLLGDLRDKKLVNLNQLSRSLINPKTNRPFNQAYFQQFITRRLPLHLDRDVRDLLIRKLDTLGLLDRAEKSSGENSEDDSPPNAAEGYHSSTRNMEGSFTMEQERREIIALIHKLDRAGLQHIHQAAKAQIALLERDMRLPNPLAKRAGR